MFQGFTSQNAPAIQIWDSYATQASSTVSRRISLQDDCAPIQLFKTGANTTAINVYLPNSPVEGRRITIINSAFMFNKQIINIFSSDRSAFSSGNATTNPIYILGQGQTLDLCFSSTALSFGSNGAPGYLATGWISLNQQPSSSYSYESVSFGRNNSITGNNSGILSGLNHSVNNAYSTITGGLGHTINGRYNFIGGGQTHTITASCFNATISGGRTNYIQSDYGTISGGDGNSITNTFGTIGGGSSNLVSSLNGTVVGGLYGSTRSLNSNTVFSASGGFGIRGTSQKTICTYTRTTYNATSGPLTSDGSSSASTTNQLILPASSAFYFKGRVVAGVTAGGDTKTWTIEGAIKRNSTAASTAFVGTPTVTSLFADVGAAAWTLALTVDTTLGGLTMTATGAASTTIQWVASVDVTEMTI
jgi:hypothetical protein